MYFTKQQQQEKRSIIFAFAIGFVMAAMALFISCGAEQPVMSEEELFIEQAEKANEYYLTIPGEGVRYRTPDMKKPISIKFGDTLSQIEEMYKNSKSTVKIDNRWNWQDIKIRGPYVGALTIYFKEYRASVFYVRIGDWKLPNGIGITNSIRWDITDHYGVPDREVSGYTCSYDQDNIKFTFPGDKYLVRSNIPPPDANDPIVMMSIRPIE